MGMMNPIQIDIALYEDPKQRKRKAHVESTSPENMDMLGLINMTKDRMYDQEDRERDKVERRKITSDRL